MSIRSEADWKGLQAAGRVVRLALEALERRIAPGVTTAELDRLAATLFAAHGARPAPALVYGFPGTVLISVNDEVVHGVPGTRRLQLGDIVTLDVTVEKYGYMTDAARTVCVGEISLQASRLLACVRSAFTQALSVARAGQPVRHVSRAIQRHVQSQGFSVAAGFGGHGIGRTIHEPPAVPNEVDPKQHDILTEGLVVAIEPIICEGAPETITDPDGWTIRTKDGSLSAHHENTVVITRGYPLLLTAA